MNAILVTGLVAAAIMFLHDVLLIAFGGLLVAVLLSAGIDVLRTRVPIPRWAALLLIVIFAGTCLALALLYGGSILTRQFEALRTALPRALQESLAALQMGPLGALLPTSSSDVQSIASSAVGLVQRATGMISSTLGVLLSVGVMFFVGVCIAAEPDLYRRGFLAVIPAVRRPMIEGVLDATSQSLRAWLAARLVSMFAIAFLSGIGLMLLQIPYAIALSVLAGLLAFVPNIGPVIAGIPAVLLALAISPQRALLVILMYWLAHALDDFIIIPIAERRIVKLPPALTILMQIGLGSLFGILGVAFAAPLTAVAIVGVRRLWVDANVDPPEPGAAREEPLSVGSARGGHEYLRMPNRSA